MNLYLNYILNKNIEYECVLEIRLLNLAVFKPSIAIVQGRA